MLTLLHSNETEWATEDPKLAVIGSEYWCDTASKSTLGILDPDLTLWATLCSVLGSQPRSHTIKMQTTNTHHSVLCFEARVFGLVSRIFL